MTRDEAKQLLPIIQAYSEGKTVQYGGEDQINPAFCGYIEKWRIKPEPIECWAVVFSDGSIMACEDSDEARRRAYDSTIRVIRMREVL